MELLVEPNATFFTEDTFLGFLLEGSEDVFFVLFFLLLLEVELDFCGLFPGAVLSVEGESPSARSPVALALSRIA